MGTFISRYLELAKYETTIGRELLGGLTMFLAASYIVVVNPAILSAAGADPRTSFLATVAITVLATLTMGFWARLPLLVSTGMEMNAFVAVYVVGTLGFSWPQALGLVFWSGALMVAATLSRLRERLIEDIPVGLKLGIAVSLGMFLLAIGLRLAGVLLYSPDGISGIGSLITIDALSFAFCLAVVWLVDKRRLPGAISVGILMTAILHNVLNRWFQAVDTSTIPGLRSDGRGPTLDLTAIIDFRALGPVLVLFGLDFFGSIAKLIGLTMHTNLAPGGNIPRRRQALLIDGVGTSVAAFLGTTSVVIFVESALGLAAGARTGLAAITAAVLFASLIPFYSLVHLIPVAATTGALAYVGMYLIPNRTQIQSLALPDRAGLVVMALLAFVTLSLGKAMLGGFFIYCLLSLCRGHRVSPIMWFATLLLLVSEALQHI